MSGMSKDGDICGRELDPSPASRSVSRAPKRWLRGHERGRAPGASPPGSLLPSWCPRFGSGLGESDAQRADVGSRRSFAQISKLQFF